MGISYQVYGIDPVLVERVKLKMKNPETKQRIKSLLQDVTKADLQNLVTLAHRVGIAAHILGEPLNDSQTDQIIDFIVAQKIDPSNTFHLINLWAMFR